MMQIKIALNLEIAEYFERAVECYDNPKMIANVMISEVLRLLQRSDDEDQKIPFQANALADYVKLIDDRVINASIGKKGY